MERHEVRTEPQRFYYTPFDASGRFDDSAEFANVETDRLVNRWLREGSLGENGHTLDTARKFFDNRKNFFGAEYDHAESLEVEQDSRDMAALNGRSDVSPDSMEADVRAAVERTLAPKSLEVMREWMTGAKPKDIAVTLAMSKTSVYYHIDTITRRINKRRRALVEVGFGPRPVLLHDMLAAIVGL